MIVRIATESQYRLPDSDADRLNQLDNETVAAVDAGDQARFKELFEQMLQLVRADGERLGDGELARRKWRFSGKGTPAGMKAFAVE